MARLFISNSSRDNAHAVALANSMRANGWDDLFLDLNPERGIVAGERWERALHDAAHRCEVIVLLVSRSWIASDWCEVSTVPPEPSPTDRRYRSAR